MESDGMKLLFQSYLSNPKPDDTSVALTVDCEIRRHTSTQMIWKQTRYQGGSIKIQESEVKFSSCLLHYYEPADNICRLAQFVQSITSETHGFGFAVVLPSCLERYRKVVLLLSRTHLISRRELRH